MYTRRCRGDFVPHVELKPLSLSSCRYAPLSSPARRFHLSADDKTSRLPPDGPGGVSSGTPSPWQRPADYDELRAARKQSVNKHKQPLDVFMREWGLKGAMWVDRRLARVVSCRVVSCRTGWQTSGAEVGRGPARGPDTVVAAEAIRRRPKVQKLERKSEQLSCPAFQGSR